MNVVHCCSCASQPDVQLLCTNAWTTPAWGSVEETATGIDGVYKADSGDLYTFTGKLVTCGACLKAMGHDEATG